MTLDGAGRDALRDGVAAILESPAAFDRLALLGVVREVPGLLARVDRVQAVVERTVHGDCHGKPHQCEWDEALRAVGAALEGRTP